MPMCFYVLEGGATENYNPAMTTTTNASATTLLGLTEGNRYVLIVTGAESAVALEFQPVEGGAWFPFPGFNATPAAGVVSADFICPVSRMRVTIASAQVNPYTAIWVKATMPEN